MSRLLCVICGNFAKKKISPGQGTKICSVFSTCLAVPLVQKNMWQVKGQMLVDIGPNLRICGSSLCRRLLVNVFKSEVASLVQI